jgi:hypothetical protein
VGNSVMALNATHDPAGGYLRIVTRAGRHRHLGGTRVRASITDALHGFVARTCLGLALLDPAGT